MPDYIDDPPEVLANLRAICLTLPEAYEEPAWAGRRWRIRGRTIAHVRTAETEAAPVTWMKFRSTSPEREALLEVGHPFFPGGRNTLGMLLDADTDWAEVSELLTDSYLLLAPKKLALLVHRPPPVWT
jgi:hypothetical protein